MSFEPKLRKPGDIISSAEWNEALQEIAKLRGDVERLVQQGSSGSGGASQQEPTGKGPAGKGAAGKEPAERDGEFVKKTGDELTGKFTLTGDLKIKDGKVGIGTDSPAEPLHVVGKLLGAACDAQGRPLRIACGSTPKGSTAWQVHPGAPNRAVFVDVDTSAAGFKETPLYFTSLHGEYDGRGKGHHWHTTGGNAVYLPKPGGFRIFVQMPGMNMNLTPAFANGDGWHIQWLAVGV